MADLREHVLSIRDFENFFKELIGPKAEDRIKAYGLRYADLSVQERDACIKRIVSVLLSENLVYSGEHRHDQWEKGWGENLDELSRNTSLEAMLPRYFGKYEINRLNQEFIRPVSKNFEYNMLGVILDWLFEAYLSKHETVYEFGCGTGHNLLRLRSLNSGAELWGLDWARSSQVLIQKYAHLYSDKKLFARKFDYFNPDADFQLKRGSAVYTVASLEQIGAQYHAFVDFILKNKPDICIHVEPIEELLDENNLMDYLSLAYFKKRRYLSGYLTHLKDLESKGKLKIVKIRRNYIGSFFIEGYSVIMWRPLS